MWVEEPIVGIMSYRVYHIELKGVLVSALFGFGFLLCDLGLPDRTLSEELG
jgi:hypothetical protein